MTTIAGGQGAVAASGLMPLSYVHPRLSSVGQALQVDLQEPSSITVTFVEANHPPVDN